MTIEIKDCPFCGSTADVQNDFGVDYWVQCTNLHCGSVDGTIYGSPAPAIEHWNRRPEPAATPAVANGAQENLPDMHGIPMPSHWFGVWPREQQIGYIDGYRAAIAAVVPNAALVDALRNLLANSGYTTMSDDDLREEARLGNGNAPILLAARAALASVGVKP